MVLEPVRVHESSSVVVTNASLNLQDLDTQSSELVIVVTKSPEHGKSRQGGVGAGTSVCASVCVSNTPDVRQKPGMFV